MHRLRNKIFQTTGFDLCWGDFSPAAFDLINTLIILTLFVTAWED